MKGVVLARVVREGLFKETALNSHLSEVEGSCHAMISRKTICGRGNSRYKCSQA